MKNYKFIIKQILEKEIVVNANSKNEAIEEFNKLVKDKQILLNPEENLSETKISEPICEDELKINKLKNIIAQKIDEYIDLMEKTKGIIDNIGYYFGDVIIHFVNKKIYECDNDDILKLSNKMEEIAEFNWSKAKRLGITKETFDNEISCYLNLTYKECLKDFKSRVYEIKLIDDYNKRQECVECLEHYFKELNVQNIDEIQTKFNTLCSNNKFNFDNEYILKQYDMSVERELEMSENF